MSDLDWWEHDCREVHVEVKDLRENKLRLAAAYHALDARCDRLAYLLGFLLAQYDRAVEIHARVRMDTGEDRELHERAVAAMREAVRPVREALEAPDG